MLTAGNIILGMLAISGLCMLPSCMLFFSNVLVVRACSTPTSLQLRWLIVEEPGVELQRCQATRMAPHARAAVSRAGRRVRIGLLCRRRGRGVS